MMLSKRFSEAVEFARVHHEGHNRKGSSIPYLTHLLAVAGLAIEDAAADPGLQDQVEDIAIAALLHDVLEDTEVTADELEAAFGSVVREIVEECSDAEGPGNKPPWLLRKQQYLDDLEFASDAALCVALADKRHNALSTVVDAEAEGPEFWARFSAGPQDQMWWYRAVASIIGFW
ncbi:MAG TPA: bifunctional (p)ppGpp synthetase/guanosine-3',5'-bis(diphosphate) 3'-pyrophosphohydrolase, partial [Acidimicrobiia bacterium]|nr:bifunctional (p)ppGpp synthetase/guanosine-3',5'-bis(diphosphate) 3'-pyrophosphohydrolase [Acidimicrobiia bacterium]